jgi:TRAF3-interacting protein 1
MSDYWTETIKAFDGLFSYPKLEEKYLKRPPFKYIFQIFLECSKISDISGGGIINA